MSERFTGGRQRIVRAEPRAIALTAWPKPDVLINMQDLYVNPDFTPLAEFWDGTFYAFLEPVFWTEADTTFWTYPPYSASYRASHPIELVGFALEITNGYGGFVPRDLTMQGRIWTSQAPTGPFLPYGDWVDLGSRSEHGLLNYGSEFNNRYFEMYSEPFVGGHPPLGYARYEVRGTFRAEDGMHIRWVYFNVTRRYREDEV